jgi:UTP--glucose-1-phosphate uridylyltransferase
MAEISKAVIPAAGLGTRLLPATKSQPKEMLPVGRKPCIQYVVEELQMAGITDVLIITGATKRAIEDHFDENVLLRSELLAGNKTSQLEELSALDAINLRICYVRQRLPTGMADAVALARGFVGDEPFVLALGDTIIASDAGAPMLLRLVQRHLEESPRATIAAKRVSGADISRYGVLDVEEIGSMLYEIKGIVEKPSRPEDAPSNLTISARYVIEPEIFDAIDSTPPAGGMTLFTDCLMTLAQGGRVLALENRRGDTVYDIGSPELYAKAFVSFALEDPGMASALREYLAKLSSEGDLRTT